jgi:hypothetical protein
VTGEIRPWHRKDGAAAAENETQRRTTRSASTKTEPHQHHNGGRSKNSALMTPNPAQANFSELP